MVLSHPMTFGCGCVKMIKSVNFSLGIENFKELRENNCYYINKTGLIAELLGQTFKVNLITRPQRFGKTLTMSMLAELFVRMLPCLVHSI